jgi:hypothetical protein
MNTSRELLLALPAPPTPPAETPVEHAVLRDPAASRSTARLLASLAAVLALVVDRDVLDSLPS